MKQLKAPFIAIASILILTALMLTFLEPPGQATRSESDGQTPALPDGRWQPRQTPPAGASPRALEPFYRRISEASDTKAYRAAARHIAAEAPAQHFNALMEQLLTRWVVHDTDAALDYAAALEGEQNGRHLLEYALLAAGGSDFGRAIEWLSKQSPAGADKQKLLVALYQGPAGNTPREALRHIDLLEEGEFKDNMVSKLVGQWAQNDTAGALSWLNSQLPLTGALHQLHESLFSSLMENDFDKAGALIQNMPVGERKHRLARRYVVELGERGIPEALQWARTLTDPESYRIALSAGYEAWLRQESAKTVILEELMSESDSDFRNHLINEVALDIAAQDPGKLGEVVDQLPPSAQGAVAEKVVRFWKERAPDEATAWVRELPPGTAKDHASSVLVQYFTKQRRQEHVLALTANIENSRMRYEAARRAVVDWYRRSPETALALLEQMSFLSDTERQSISSELKPGE